ncbi:MAG: radical SAM protein, partial [Nitrospirota bacterium]|nr:radical SAM protein [Nitrospirota bacterium]
SIQGESTFSGLPCTFVRLSGCNLRCSYCDTTYSYEEGTEMSVQSIMDKVAEEGIHLVEITGGEPLLQHDEVVELTKRLLDAGYGVLVETNGSVKIDFLDNRVIVIMDIKTPASNMSEKNDLSNIAYLKPEDEVKFVICDRNDYEWSKKMVLKQGLSKRCRVLFSPSAGTIAPRELAGWILQDRLEVRLNMQLHKIMYDPDERGV